MTRILVLIAIVVSSDAVLAKLSTKASSKISIPDAVESFREAVRLGLEQSPSVQAKAVLLESSRVDRRQKVANWTPDIVARVDRVVEGTPAEATAIDVSLNVTKFGSDIAALRSSNALLRAQEARFEIARFQTESAVAGALFDFYLAKAEVRYFKRSLELKDETLRFTTEKYRRGQYPEQQVSLARLDRDQSEVSLLEAETRLIKSKDKIRLLTGIQEVSKLDWPWLSLLEGDEDLVKSRARARAATFEQMETRALREEMDAAHQAYMATKLAYFPRVDLTGTWETAKAGSTENGRWGVLLRVSIPLWDKMTTYSKAAARVAERETLREQLRYQRIETEIRQQSLAPVLEKNRAAAKKALASVKIMQSLLEDSLRRFQLGKSTLNDVFLDEDRFLRAEQSLQNALAGFHRQLIEACHLENLSILECY